MTSRTMPKEATFGELGFPAQWHQLFDEAWEECDMPIWSYHDRKNVVFRTGSLRAWFFGKILKQRAVTWQGVVHVTWRLARIYERTRWPYSSDEIHDREAFLSLSHESLHVYEQRVQNLESLPSFMAWFFGKYFPHVLRLRVGRKHPLEKDAYAFQDALRKKMDKIPFAE